MEEAQLQRQEFNKDFDEINDKLVELEEELYQTKQDRLDLQQ